MAGELNGVDCSGLYHDVNRILNNYTNKPIHTNINKVEQLAFQNVRKDKNCITVTADKGICQLSTKNSLKFCKTQRNKTFISETEYTLLRPNGSNSLAVRFYGLPKIYKKKHAYEPIVLTSAIATYNTAITKILQNYCGKSSSFVKDRTYFIQKIQHLSINLEESLVSFDVSTLITSISVPVTVQVLNSKFHLHQFHQCLPDP